ncbi:HAMP domain-containing histidine kinase [Moritella sp. 24]|uniref:sensor histidine kinase n=1 Tax=Moritella sp. 24 TaxID=2746230 RepID=UPI001BA745EB|nr:HAMP domain-containing sensor histidine kinase [Moritella sp. 24]QUM77396.1 HAMP domain-containing histidine kinase [Moritella sp. 24]
MKKLYAFLYRKPLGNSIKDAKTRLIFIFSIIALTSSFFVFFSFSLYLVFNEDRQIELHLKSFERIAKDQYPLVKSDTTRLGPYVYVYYSEDALADKIRAELPYQEGVVTKINSFSHDGFMVYYAPFINASGQPISLYLTVGTRDMDFGDDNWKTLMLISLGLMVFLIVFLSVALRRVFGDLMAPVAELGEQLREGKEADFVVSNRAIDELKQFKDHLNSYKKMKERLVKQEMMFAKYASHELKTPIAIVLGAANLQGMKDDAAFQDKQRTRILTAATNMQSTVEVLLNIVKQENANCSKKLYLIPAEEVAINKYQTLLQPGVELTIDVVEHCEINLPPTVLAMILKNLISNAARFTSLGGIEVSVCSDQITVSDSGCGLQSDGNTEHGLGLLIVRRLCTSYGWQFSLTDNSAGGCCAKLCANN